MVVVKGERRDVKSPVRDRFRKEENPATNFIPNHPYSGYKAINPFSRHVRSPVRDRLRICLGQCIKMQKKARLRLKAFEVSAFCGLGEAISMRRN